MCSGASVTRCPSCFIAQNRERNCSLTETNSGSQSRKTRGMRQRYNPNPIGKRFRRTSQRRNRHSCGRCYVRRLPPILVIADLILLSVLIAPYVARGHRRLIHIGSSNALSQRNCGTMRSRWCTGSQKVQGIKIQLPPTRWSRVYLGRRSGSKSWVTWSPGHCSLESSFGGVGYSVTRPSLKVTSGLTPEAESTFRILF